MTGYIIFWAVSLVALALFLAYWFRRIERGHAERMAVIAADEMSDMVWIDAVARRRQDEEHATNLTADAEVRIARANAPQTANGSETISHRLPL
jgi:hypothetical protein